MTIIIHVIDAFTHVSGTGNRAGVVLNAGSLSAKRMQEIATFAGYSETAFVLPATAEDHDVYVRYFTPESEVPICGHATVATHTLLAQHSGNTNYQIQARTGAGILPIHVSGQGADLIVTMTQGSVEYGDMLNEAQCVRLLAALGLQDSDRLSELPIQIVSTGHSKVMVPVASRAATDGAMPIAEDLITLSQEIDCNGYFVFVPERTTEQFQTYGRMFAPAIGIFEDPVTGNANGPAAAFLAYHEGWDLSQPICYPGHQGHKMGKPGTVWVSIESVDSNIVVKVAGHAISSGQLPYNGLEL